MCRFFVPQNGESQRSKFKYQLKLIKKASAVSCSLNVYRLPATGFGLGLMGKLDCAWVFACVGAWVHGCMGGGGGGGGDGVGDVWWRWEKCMCIIPGLLRLDLSIGGGLDGDGEEVVGVVSCELEKKYSVKLKF